MLSNYAKVGMVINIQILSLKSLSHTYPQARLMDVPDPNPRYAGTNNTFVEVKGFGGWGILCYGSLDFKTAQVIINGAFARETRTI